MFSIGAPLEGALALLTPWRSASALREQLMQVDDARLIRMEDFYGCDCRVQTVQSLRLFRAVVAIQELRATGGLVDSPIGDLVEGKRRNTVDIIDDLTEEDVELLLRIK